MLRMPGGQPCSLICALWLREAGAGLLKSKEIPIQNVGISIGIFAQEALEPGNAGVSNLIIVLVGDVKHILEDGGKLPREIS